ncbi:hypothetical protein Tco_0632599 [Tanacetum coccineum]
MKCSTVESVEHRYVGKKWGSRDFARRNVVLAQEKIEPIRARLEGKAQVMESYADNRRRPIEFNVGDFVMLKASPWKGVIRKCLADESSVSLDAVESGPEIPPEKNQLKFLGEENKKSVTKKFQLVKVQWTHRVEGHKIMWGTEE